MTAKPNQSQRVAKYYWQHARKYPRYLLGLGLSVPATVLINSFLPTLIVANVLSRLAQHDYQSHVRS
jgi:hypothetical protein